MMYRAYTNTDKSNLVSKIWFIEQDNRKNKVVGYVGATDSVHVLGTNGDVLLLLNKEEGITYHPTIDKLFDMRFYHVRASRIKQLNNFQQDKLLDLISYCEGYKPSKTVSLKDLIKRMRNMFKLNYKRLHNAS